MDVLGESSAIGREVTLGPAWRRTMDPYLGYPDSPSAIVLVGRDEETAHSATIKNPLRQRSQPGGALARRASSPIELISL